MDLYRAPCVEATDGCRNCGAEPVKPKRFYCSDECKLAFESNHFWGTARLIAMQPGAHFDGYGFRRGGTPAPCARKSDECSGPADEVNHIAPVNGDRQNFGCQNHQDNLEPLCHHHHLEVTAEQRRDGRIGTPESAAAIRLSDEVKARRAERREAKQRANPRLGLL